MLIHPQTSFDIFSLFSQLCKKHGKLVDLIRQTAMAGGKKADQASGQTEEEEEDQD